MTDLARPIRYVVVGVGIMRVYIIKELGGMLTFGLIHDDNDKIASQWYIQ